MDATIDEIKYMFTAEPAERTESKKNPFPHPCELSVLSGQENSKYIVDTD